MHDLARYAFANAKIRAMRSVLLDASWMDRLSGSADVGELIDELKKTAYKDVLARLPQDAVDLVALERELILYDVSLCRKVHLALNDAGLKEFLDIFLQRYELQQLKVALRIWHKKIPVSLDDYLLGEAVSFPIDFKKIILCRTIEEVALLLEDTPYERSLWKAREKFKTTNSVFFLEAALDVDYYRRLNACMEQFSGLDRSIARKLIGIEIDMININWLIRLRTYYSASMGLDWIIPGGDRVDAKRIRQSYTAEGLGPVIAAVASGPYRKIQELAQDNARLIEGLLSEVLLQEVRHVLAGYPFTIGTALGYLILKHRETACLVSLFYSKSLGLTKGALC